ncbi:hypothetical protein, partial [Klebsiella variicola]|uniref:hypothetical protein n=1 Tax=Klebsiella variicola TaxID=244366 RepID=UPI002730AD70
GLWVQPDADWVAGILPGGMPADQAQLHIARGSRVEAQGSGALPVRKAVVLRSGEVPAGVGIPGFD